MKLYKIPRNFEFQFTGVLNKNELRTTEMKY